MSTCKTGVSGILRDRDEADEAESDSRNASRNARVGVSECRGCIIAAGLFAWCNRVFNYQLHRGSSFVSGVTRVVRAAKFPLCRL